MLEASKKLGIYRNPSMEADVHRKIANCYEMAGNYENALLQVKLALETDSIHKDLNGRIAGFRQEGKIYFYMGLIRKGISSLEKALELSEGMDQSLKNINKVSIADNYLALGQLYSVTGWLEKASGYTKKARALFSQADDKRGEMESEITLASISFDMGDIAGARELANNSLNSAVLLGLGTSRHNQLLASMSSETGEYENALHFQEKALNEAKNYGIMGQIIWTTIGLGDIYSRIGDLNRAEKYYREARLVKDTLYMKTKSLDASLDLRLGEVMNANEYYLSQGSFTGEAVSSLRLAELFLKDGKYDSAGIYLDLSEKKFKAAGNRQGISNVYLVKGRILVDDGKLSAAQILLDSASLMTDFPETTWQAWFHMGRLKEKLNRDDDAIESYRKSIGIIEKIRGNLTIDDFKSTYFDSKREVYDRLVRLLLKTNKPLDALRISEQARARAFYDILANKKIDFKGSVSGDLISREQTKRMEIQKLYKLLQKGPWSEENTEGSARSGMEQIRETLETSQAEYDEILQNLRVNDPAYAEMVTAQPVNPASLMSALDDQTAMLAYWISDDELISWLITKSEITFNIVPFGRKSLTALVERCRKSIRSNAMDEMRPDLMQLWSLLIDPHERSLNSYRNLVIIPNGPLHFVPFQALMDLNGDYLVQKFNFSYAPSASVFMICNNRSVKSGSKFFGVALSDIVLDNRSGLPGTEEEVRNILPLFPDNLSTFGIKSTETFVRNNAPAYNFIHFATHGSYNYEQPLYSHLLFSPTEEDDGRFNVYEVFELDLNATLVTLSACESGLGNISQGDEMVGLNRAFLFAGSSSVIVSLWAVADYPTSLLMSNFYRYLKDYKMNEALSLAQRDVIKVYPQPLYWAPFILIGNGQVSSK